MYLFQTKLVLLSRICVRRSTTTGSSRASGDLTVAVSIFIYLWQINDITIYKKASSKVSAYRINLTRALNKSRQ